MLHLPSLATAVHSDPSIYGFPSEPRGRRVVVFVMSVIGSLPPSSFRAPSKVSPLAEVPASLHLHFGRTDTIPTFRNRIMAPPKRAASSPILFPSAIRSFFAPFPVPSPPPLPSLRVDDDDRRRFRVLFFHNAWTSCGWGSVAAAAAAAAASMTAIGVNARPTPVEATHVVKCSVWH